MLSADMASEIAVIAGFKPRPNHVGSIHDDSAARQYGYRSALVPGIIIYGYMANWVAESWGLDWVERGTMGSRSRRPVYEGDRIAITAAPVTQDDSGRRVEMEVRDTEGNIVATGTATLPHARPALPDLSDFPVLPITRPLRPIAAGGVSPGDRFGSEDEAITAETHRELLDYFRQTWPVFAARGVVHPTRFPHIVTHNALASYALPTPSIFVSAATQHLGLVRIGDRLSTSGVITDVYERKGNHYTDQRHVVIANGGTPVALVQRTSIYAARKESETMSGALQGLRVLDLSETVAGQFCARMLADYGAEVTLIEPPGGSAVRGMALLDPARAENSLLFFILNLGKRSLLLDGAAPGGKALLARLVGAADVAIVGRDAEVEALRAANRNCIICVVSGFGRDGPWRDWHGSEMIYQALSGMMNHNGLSGREPLYGVGQRASHAAGIAAYIAVLAALHARAGQGGQVVSIDIAETASSMWYPYPVIHAYSGWLEQRGERGQPVGQVKCSDGDWVCFWVRGEQWPAACAALGRPDLAQDPRFAGGGERQKLARGAGDHAGHRHHHHFGRVPGALAGAAVDRCEGIPAHRTVGPPCASARARLLGNGGDRRR